MVIIVSHVADNSETIKPVDRITHLENLPKNSDDASLEEGRKLEFIENTLVAPHRLDQRLATGLLVLGEYFRLMVFPKELSFYYGYSKITTTDFSNYQVWISLLIYLLLLFLSIYSINKHPLIAIGGFWYLSCIFIFSNLPVLVAGMIGERLSFCASLGFCIFIGGVVNWLKPQFSYTKMRGVEVLSLLLLVAFSARTFARNEKWESHVTLMRNDIEHLENSAQANYLLAIHLIKEAEDEPKVDVEKVNQSISYFKRAIEIYPYYYNFYFDLGRAHLVANQYELAKQNFITADQLEPNAILGLFELAKVCFILKEYDEVIRNTKLYLGQSKANPIIYELAAYSAYYNDAYQQSIRFAQEGLSQFPNNDALSKLLVDLQRRTP